MTVLITSMTVSIHDRTVYNSSDKSIPVYELTDRNMNDRTISIVIYSLLLFGQFCFAWKRSLIPDWRVRDIRVILTHKRIVVC